MNTLIIYISDIHFTGTRPENEGVVINAFLEDVKKQLGEMSHKDVFLFLLVVIWYRRLMTRILMIDFGMMS